MTEPLPSYAPPPGTPTRRPAREGWLVADLVIGWLLLAVGVALGAVASFVGVFSVMMSDSCPSSQDAGVAPCDDGRIGAGVLLATAGHWVVLVVAFGAMLWLSFRPRPLVWVPLLAMVLGGATFVGGEVLAWSGVPAHG